MIEWIKSPNFYNGRSTKISTIVCHWWDDPAENPSIQGVINTFKNPATQVSAHYIVSDTRIVQMVHEADTAWHARSANPFSIGIEIDPKTPGKTYETVGKLVYAIRKRHGNLALKKHSDYVDTRCPGTINLNKIEEYAKGDEMLTREDIIREYKVNRGQAPSESEIKTHLNGGTMKSLSFGFEKENANRIKAISDAEDRVRKIAAERDLLSAKLTETQKELESCLSAPRAPQDTIPEKDVKDTTNDQKPQEDAPTQATQSFWSWLSNLFSKLRRNLWKT